MNGEFKRPQSARLVALIFFLVGAASACGKVTMQVGSAKVSFNPGEPSAAADVASCPADMTLIPAQPGYSSYCIESAARSAAPHPAAQVTCGSAGRSVCSFAELTVADAAGAVTAIQPTNQVYPFGYYVREVSGNQVGQYFAAGQTGLIDPSSLGNPAQPFYCCSR